MKKSLTIIALALAAMHANADTVFIAENKAGGTINLTDNTSTSCPKGYFVYYSTGKSVNDNIDRACWRYVDGNAHVMFKNGTERMFPIDRFELTEYGTANYGDDKPAKPAKSNRRSGDAL